MGAAALAMAKEVKEHSVLSSPVDDDGKVTCFWLVCSAGAEAHAETQDYICATIITKAFGVAKFSLFPDESLFY